MGGGGCCGAIAKTDGAGGGVCMDMALRGGGGLEVVDLSFGTSLSGCIASLEEGTVEIVVVV